MEDIDFGDLVKQIVETIDGEGRIKLGVQNPPASLQSRRAPLQLVLQNLIDNALKYSDRPDPRIIVRVEDDGKQLKVTVSDDGPGIDMRHHDKIFLLFRTLEGKGGTGMGLALVKKAVEDNGGTIRVVSNPPDLCGTAFVFTWKTGD